MTLVLFASARYNFRMTDVTLPGKQDEKEPESKDAAKPVPVAIQRLMDEVRNRQVTDAGCFDRAHNRHNR